MQEDYRTFTIDTREGHFPNPQQMFADLRNMGVKCCTNITPYISSAPNPEFGEYQTYKEVCHPVLSISLRTASGDINI